ncbi:hypothetical protein [Enhygromyxa salina]|uniref:Uncharacterized protein n=1 Tax=Enhygromyxa salina TaxID=215803 RepID=A0A2S9YR64_9BACT|nr:hypothetical protein [Enhygromyxa salina]PRQ07570.1 hypothetical protein ENSA7_25600 [Enhygromyxa salina]
MTVITLLLSVLFSGGPQECAEVETMDPALYDVRCDDGSALINPRGDINKRCVLDGCSIASQSCWDYRLEHCYDNGVLNGQCELASETCTNTPACLHLMAFCSGTFECANDDIWSGWCVCEEEQ